MSQNEADHIRECTQAAVIAPAQRASFLRSGILPWSGISWGWWLIAGTLIVCAFCGDRLIRYRHHASVVACTRECFDRRKESQWEELAKVSERWSKLEPQKAEPWLFRAEAAENTKDWVNLVQYLDRIPRSDRRAVGALVRKAAAEFEYLNRPWDGVKTCDEVLGLDSRVLLAHKQTIFFHAMTLQRAEMVRRIRRAIRVRRESPGAYAYLVSASWLYSGSIYRQNTRWLEADPDSETFLVARALHVYTTEVKTDLERAGEFEDIPAEEEMLRRYPQNLELVAYFLNQSITNGDFERVLSLLEMIPQNRADLDARFWRARAWCEDTLGQFELAERSLRRAFALDPYWWKIHYQMQDLLRRLGRFEESVQFSKIHKLSWELSVEIMTLNRKMDELDGEQFCRSLLKLVELIGDDEVGSALRERLSEK